MSVDPRFQVTEKGFVKSRYLDDKAAVACVYTMLKYLGDNNIKPKNRTILAFPHMEEVGFGGAFVPSEACEYVALDIGLIGPDLDGTEFGVSICAKDVYAPYDYDLTNKLIGIAEDNDIPYAVDLFFRYSTDANAAVRGGNDLRAAAFGFVARNERVPGGEVLRLAPVQVDGQTVSSTRIRELLQQGQPERAARMLGRSHFLTGTVIHGKHLGRKIGIPTANTLLPEGVVIPRYGVYVSRVNGMAAVTNIGVRPTLDDGEAPTVESRLLEFDGDLYGKTIRIELMRYLRPERKFSSVEELQAQVFRDGEEAKKEF